MSAPVLCLVLETPRTPEGYRLLVSSRSFDDAQFSLLAQVEWTVTNRSRSGNQREGREFLKLYAKKGRRPFTSSSREIENVLDRLLRERVDDFLKGIGEVDWQRLELFTPELQSFLPEIERHFNSKDESPRPNFENSKLSSRRQPQEPESPADKKFHWLIVALWLLASIAGIVAVLMWPVSDEPAQPSDGAETSSELTSVEDTEKAKPDPGKTEPESETGEGQGPGNNQRTSDKQAADPPSNDPEPSKGSEGDLESDPKPVREPKQLADEIIQLIEDEVKQASNPTDSGIIDLGKRLQRFQVPPEQQVKAVKFQVGKILSAEKYESHRRQFKDDLEKLRQELENSMNTPKQ